MKKIFLLFTVLFVGLGVFGQNRHIVFSSCVNLLKNSEAEIVITGKIDDGWHMYSFNPGGDGMAIVPEIKINQEKGVKTIGKVTEHGKLVTEEIIGDKWNWYKHKVTYKQRIKYKDLKQKIGWEIYYTICDDKGCLPPMTQNFTVDLDVACDGGSNVAKVSGKKVDLAKVKAKRKATEDSLAKIKNDNKLLLKLQRDSLDKSLADEAKRREDSLKSVNNTEDGNDNGVGTDKSSTDEKVYGEYGTIVSDCGVEQEGELSMWTAFLFGILGGLAALFFPCTLPMIPMTISFFLKSAGDKKQGVKNGVFYGFSIFLVYFLLSLPFLFLGWGGNALNAFSTNVWVNLAFFAIFIVFAFSLFGYYDISLPSSMTQKIDSKSNATSFGGIFFMALTLAIVSFSCTGPILGLVLGNLENTKLITPAMSGFGIGLGVPFALFAIFPNLLKALPKSGGWLTVVKVVFGFIELAFALKFLSNADLVKQWGFLKRETFIGIWIIICVLIALYLLGIFKLKKDPTFKSTVAMKVMAVLCFVFAGYLSLDYFGKDIGLVSGFPPPEFYSYRYKESKEEGVHYVSGLKTYMDLNRAFEVAKKEGKPVMIDFTGWACVNCRKMEEKVWTKTGINKILSEDYVIASLYVDEQIELPDDEKFDSPYLDRGRAFTVGDKWFEHAMKNFKAAAQPYYALIDPVNHRILNTPRAYNENEGQYYKFLDCGLKNYKSLHE